MLEEVSKVRVLEHLPPRVQERHAQFRRCRSCGQTCRKGPHYKHLRRFLAQVFKEEDSSQSTQVPGLGFVEFLLARLPATEGLILRRIAQEG